jgi:hypothetical protein
MAEAIPKILSANRNVRFLKIRSPAPTDRIEAFGRPDAREGGCEGGNFSVTAAFMGERSPSYSSELLTPTLR